ncbi:MAG: S1C family serine protease [Jatrophihabitans sp.]|uniref:S1C family serine protease n=1 Tax=Jatrophihabitans sp. TaxID=1932789 RepID=UPI0039129638
MTSLNPYPDPAAGADGPHPGAYNPYAGYYPAYGQPLAPPATGPQRGKRGRLLGAGIAILAAGAVFGGVAVSESRSVISGNGSFAQALPTTPNPGSGGLNPNGRPGTSTSASLATAEQQKGIVTIVSVLAYQRAESAGTGMVLTSNGEILTNNHVVNGATSITVTVASTGKSYRADVVGTDPSDDVALLQLRNAPGLTTAKVGDSSDVAVGDAVVGVGNAGGTGKLQASPGAVTALNQSITATDESGQSGERLTGLIEINAAIISGDSGGPLYNAKGEIIGMDTAASANRAVTSAAYAIPIDDAVKIADRIESGVETSTIHIGLPAFLGVGVGAGGTQGAAVTTLLPGGPAGDAGITQGSTVTAIDGKQVTSADTLKSTLAKYQPGNRVSVRWTDPAGTSHTATVTLGTGPAD